MTSPALPLITPDTLRTLRRVMGWRQLDAAVWAGVDLRTWRRWETGEKQPHGLLARALQSLPATVQAQLHLF